MIFALKKTTTSPSMLKVIPICKRLQVNKYIYIYIYVYPYRSKHCLRRYPTP
jgi:hypothetical protein